jgi:hypothetical protein
LCNSRTVLMAQDLNKAFVLPSPDSVQFLDLKGYVNGNAVRLEWKTSFEKNNRGFIIQKSTDGLCYNNVAYVPSAAKSGYNQSLPEYTVQDSSGLSEKLFYRIIQRHTDSSFFYSDVIRVWNNGYLTSNISIYPNPAASHITMQMESAEDSKLKGDLTDMSGFLLLQFTWEVHTGNNTKELNLPVLPSGEYIIEWTGLYFPLLSSRIIIN